MLITLLWLHLLSYSAQAQELHLGATQWCPYTCEKTPEQGILTAYVTALLAKQNINVTITFGPWTRITKSVQAGELDGLVTQTRSEAPEQWTTQIPIILHQNCFYTRSDSTWRYQGIDSLKSLRLGIVDNYGYEDKLDLYLQSQKNKNSEVTAITGEDLTIRLYKMLQAKRLDLYLSNDLVNDWELKQHQVQEPVRQAAQEVKPFTFPCILERPMLKKF
jgi:polar amino acid transport system substrate-binding protein